MMPFFKRKRRVLGDFDSAYIKIVAEARRRHSNWEEGFFDEQGKVTVEAFNIIANEAAEGKVPPAYKIRKIWKNSENYFHYAVALKLDDGRVFSSGASTFFEPTIEPIIRYFVANLGKVS